MAYEEESLFTFQLSESLWFKRGQEVDELMGISLEPEISIQEFDDHVSIRGVIELAGEFFKSDEVPQEESQIVSLRDHASYRTIEEIETHEDGISEFFHRFPVEVSIPKYRVNSLDDLMVSIDSFDYELPEKGQLKLNATVAIHGVMEERVQEEESEAIQEENQEDRMDNEPSVEESFSFDFKQEESLQGGESPESLPKDDEEESGRWKYKQTQTFSEFFEKEEEKAEESEESPSSSYESSSPFEESSDESRSQQEVPQDARYLTNIFRNKEEQFARMRMCIVQEDETLISIAERYQIPPAHLSRANDLGDQDVSKGQILYIPTKK